MLGGPGAWNGHSLGLSLLTPSCLLELPKVDIKQLVGSGGLECGQANLFCKGPGSKYFWLCGPDHLIATT